MSVQDLLPFYVNGRASPEERAEVEAAVANDPALSAELEFLRSLSDAVTAERETEGSPGAFGLQRLMREIDRDESGGPSEGRFPRQGGDWRGVLTGAAAAAALMIGMLIGGGLGGFSGPRPEGPPGWKLSAAIYQRLYTAETFQLASAPAEQRLEGLERLAALFELDPAALVALEALALQRADLLNFKGRALGQVAFVDADGVPISLCVMKRVPGDGAAVGPTQVRFLDMNGVEWRTDTHVFLLIGRAAPETLEDHAAEFSATLI